MSQHNINELRILGIDPGSIICGYGIIKKIYNKQPLRKIDKEKKSYNFYTDIPNFVYVTSGRITLSTNSPLYIRLKRLYDNLIDIMRTYEPHEIAIERMFFAKSIKAALNLGHARGVALLAAASEGIKIYEYSALEVKKAVTGYGRAEKKQVIDMVKRILNFKSNTINLSEDSADALALALCHLNTTRFKET